MRRVPNLFELNALSIALFYFIFALLWILISDQVLIWITNDPELISTYQTYKGLFYVAITAVFLFLLIKQSNKKITQEKARIDHALIAADSATWSLNLNTGNIQRSQYHHKIFGLKKQPAKWALDDFYEKIYPEDRENVQEKLNKAINGQNPIFQSEYRINTPDGQTKWLQSRGTVIYDEQNQPSEIAGVISDITEEKKLEKEYQHEKELLENIFENIPVMIEITSDHLDGSRVNKAFQEFTGYTETDVENLEFMKMLYRDPEVRKVAKKAIDEADGNWYEFENYTKSGEKRIQQWANIKLTDGSTIGIGLDITEQKQLEQKNERHRQELATVYDHIPVMINMHDSKLNIFRFNNYFETLTGYSVDELKDINLVELMIPEEERMRAYEHMDKADGSWQDFTLITNNGEKLNTTWSNVEVNEDLRLGIGLDTTELKASQEEIAESRKLLQKTFESLKEAVFILEPETRTITDCNNGAVELFGYSKEELIGSRTKKLHLSKEKCLEFDQLGAKTLEEEDYFQTEFIMQKKDGTKFFSDHTVTLIKGDDGEVEKVVSVVQDITSQIEYERELKERNEFIETTLENLPIGVSVNSIDKGEVTLMNKKFSEIYGWSEEVITDIQTFFEKVYPDETYRKKIAKMIMEDINSEDASRMSWEGITVTTEDGEEKIVNAKNIPLYEQNLMISTVVDVTQRVEAERRLAESEHKYRLLFQKSPLPMYIFNPETLEFVEVNNAAVDHYGYSRDEFRNMTLFDIRPVDDHEELKKEIKRSRNGSYNNKDWRHIKKNGEEIIVQVTGTTIDYFGNKFQLILVNDITEQKKAEERVLASLVEGENKERARIARELHDGLGQYLAAANMNLDSIQSHVDNLDKRVQKQFQKGLHLLKNAVTETAQISRNLLPRVVDDYGLALAIEAMVDSYASNNDMEINYYHNIDDMKLAHEIEFNLYRIAQEGLSNAVKYSKASIINVQLIKDELDLILSIDDNGTGFDTSAPEFSSGLGLQTIKTRAGALGGEVEIDSKPEKGTMVSVIVPVKQN